MFNWFCQSGNTVYVCLNNYTMTCKEHHYISGWFFFTFINMDLQFMGSLLQTPWICTNCVFQNVCKKVCKTFCSSWKQRKIPCLHLHYTSKSHGRPWGTLTNFTFGEGRGGSRCNKWASRHVCAKCPDPHICPASQNRPGGRGFPSGGGSTILWNSSLSIQRYNITLSLSENRQHNYRQVTTKTENRQIVRLILHRESW